MPLTPAAKDEIVRKLNTALLKCVPPMVISSHSKTGMQLIGNKPVPYGYNKKIIPGMFFSSYVVRKDIISFYFFPMYMNREFSDLMPNLGKTLKGKTCFNLKRPDQVDEIELAAILKKGISAWKKLGYMR